MPFDSNYDVKIQFLGAGGSNMTIEMCKNPMWPRSKIAAEIAKNCRVFYIHFCPQMVHFHANYIIEIQVFMGLGSNDDIILIIKIPIWTKSKIAIEIQIEVCFHENLTTHVLCCNIMSNSMI